MSKYILAAAIFFSAFVFTNAFAQEKIYTCINEKGEKLFSVKAKYVSSFRNGMAEIQKTVLIDAKPFLRTGFINENGQQVVECKYDKVYPFYDNATWVKEPNANGYYLIDKTGKKLSDKTYSKVGYFSEGFCEVYNEEDKMGFVNRKGELVIPCIYLGGSFSEGLACVMPYDNATANYGFIDTTGKVVIPFQYKQPGTSSFENGECRVQINGVTCLINHKGEVVFKPALTKNCMGFSNGLSASYTNSTNRTGWGYYNKDNVWIIKPQFDNANSFVGGLAIVDKEGKSGVIDTTGKIIIPIQYATIFGDPTETGYFGVEKIENGDKEYLKADGKPFTTFPIKYLFPSNGHALLPYCTSENKYGYLTLDGTVFIEAQFDKADAFNDGKSWIRGDVSSLKYAPQATDQNFVSDYVVGEKVQCKKNGQGAYYPGTVEQLTDYYYLVTFADGSQEWVVFDSLKR